MSKPIREVRIEDGKFVVGKGYTIAEYIEALKEAKVGEQIREEKRLRAEGKLHPSDDCHTYDH